MVERPTSYELATMERSANLVAVTVKRSRELLEHRARSDSSATERATALLRAAYGQVAGAGRTMFGLTARGQAKSFLRTFVRFLLRHDPLNPSGALGAVT